MWLAKCFIVNEILYRTVSYYGVLVEIPTFDRRVPHFDALIRGESLNLRLWILAIKSEWSHSAAAGYLFCLFSKLLFMNFADYDCEFCCLRCNSSSAVILMSTCTDTGTGIIVQVAGYFCLMMWNFMIFLAWNISWNISWNFYEIFQKFHGCSADCIVHCNKVSKPVKCKYLLLCMNSIMYFLRTSYTLINHVFKSSKPLYNEN